MKKRLFTMIETVKSWNKKQWTVVLLTGILILIIAMPTGYEKEKAVSTKKSDKEEKDWIYEEELEKELEEILGEMEGVGKVKVMITLQDKGEQVLARDETIQTRQRDNTDAKETEKQVEQKTIYAQEEPYTTKEKVPNIEGVLVIAQGASDRKVKTEIYQAIKALFTVEAHKIAIVEMRSQEGL